jgi:hypothetical protein
MFVIKGINEPHFNKKIKVDSSLNIKTFYAKLVITQ